MSKIKNALIMAFVLLGLNLQAQQLHVSTSDGEANNGQNVTIDVTADQFQGLSTFQFKLTWDNTVMQYSSLTNITDGLSSYGPAQFGLPSTGSLDANELTTSWINASGAQDLPSGTVLFSVVFEAVGADCATTELTFDPDELEAGDANFVAVSDVQATGSTLKVSGADCGGGNGGGNGGGEGENECEDSTNPYLTVCDVMAAPGSTICVPVKAYNFANVEGQQTGITFNPSQLTFTGIQNLAVSESGLLVNMNNVETTGEVRQFWTDDTGENPVTLTDGTVYYEICFEVLAPTGTTIDVNLGSIGSFEPEITGEGITGYCHDSGTITVSNVTTPDPVNINVSTASGDQGSEVCLDFTVNNFTDITGMQFAISWDNSILNYSNTGAYNSAIGINASKFLFEDSDQTLRFAWDNPTPQTVANNDRLFQVCFDLVGDCANGPTSNVSVVGVSGFNLEAIVNGQNIGITTSNGSISINPCTNTHSCELVSVNQPECAGGEGSIEINVEADNTCQCNWYEVGNNTPIQTNPANTSCNLNNITAGDYRFELTDSQGAVVCTLVADLEDPTAITSNPMVTSAGCGSSGAITLNATGGTGNLSYSWSPNVSNSDSANNLAAQSYTIVVTDENGCSVTINQTVTEEVQALVINQDASTVTDASCFGESDGSIVVSVSGGCPDYSFAWSNGDGTDLEAGMYTVTVSDTQGSTATATFNVGQPQELTATSSVVDANGGANGSITITPVGGTPDFTYSWNPNVSSTNVANDLSEGTYSVTITDDNNCTFVINNIPVIDTNTGGEDLSMAELTVNDVDGCNGDCNGSLSSIVSGGSAPYTVSLTGASSETLTLQAAGAFMFEDLCAGDYSVSVSDAEGNSLSAGAEIIEPSIMSIIVTEVGRDLNDCDGFVEVSVSGGTEPYDYAWSNADFPNSNEVLNVCEGTYNVIVTDANGCQVMAEVVVLGSNPEVCYQARDIITPNDDNLNDFFTITCINNRPAALSIFDRYGRLVYENVAYDNSFNGFNSNGEELIEGGYMWVLNIDFGDGRREIKKGTLTILR